MTLRIIAGTLKGRLIKTPKSSTTRPTQGMLRGAVFNICQHQISHARFLDLFAGSGAMGYEAISRGAAHATLIESHPQAIACIKHNIAALALESRITLLPLPAKVALNKLSDPFDLIYIDPPYDTPIAPLLAALLAHNLASPHATLFIEERYTTKKASPPLDFPQLRLKDSRRFGAALLHQYHVY